PRALVHALRDAAQSLGIGSPARRLLAEAFDESVMAGYEGLAKRFDALLAEAGVLPGLTHVPLRARSAPPKRKPDPAVTGAGRQDGPPPSAPRWTADSAASAGHAPGETELFDM